MRQVLQLDIQGTPQAWITPENAATRYATGSVLWQLGDVPLTTLRGGWSVVTGLRSLVSLLHQLKTEFVMPLDNTLI